MRWLRVGRETEDVLAPVATRVRLCRRHLLRTALLKRVNLFKDATEQVSKVEGLGTVGASPGDKK
jgi:hypothetical protein